MERAQAQQVGKREPTIIDIAIESKVSKSTVSRVVNGAPNVSPATRLKVHAAMERLGYQINHAARSMRTRRTTMAGLVVPALNEVFGRQAEVVDLALRAHGIGLMISCSGWDPGESLSSIELLRSRRVDGLIVSLGDDTNAEVRSYLHNLDVSFVLLDRELPDKRYDAVLTDQNPGIADAVDHLVSVGRRSIGFVAMNSSTRPGRESLKAYQSAVARVGLRSRGNIVASNRFDRVAGEEAVDRLIANGVDAIIAAVPMAALGGILSRLAELGIRVPDDISLVGYDEHELASVKPPRLTVVDRPIDRIAAIAAQMLVDRLAEPGAPFRTEVVRTRLILGQSSAPAVSFT